MSCRLKVNGISFKVAYNVPGLSAMLLFPACRQAGVLLQPGTVAGPVPTKVGIKIIKLRIYSIAWLYSLAGYFAE